MNIDAATIAETDERTESAPVNMNAQKPSYRKAKQNQYRKAILSKYSGGTQAAVKLVPYFLDKLKKIRGTDQNARRQQMRDIATFFNYYDGNVNGRVNDLGEWESDEINPQDLTYTVPLTAPHVDSGKTLLLKTTVEFEYQPINKDSVLDGAVARMMSEICEEDIEKIFPAEKQIREILFLLTAGKTYRRHFWAKDDIEPNTAIVTEYEEGQREIPGVMVCANCQKPANEGDAACTHCNSMEFVQTESQIIIEQIPVEREIELAENQLHIPNPLAVQHELSARNLNHSGFVIERDSLPRSKAEYLYQQIIKPSNQKLSEEVAMIRSLERSVIKASNENSTADTLLRSIGGDGIEDEVGREFAWLAPHTYANFPVMEDGWYLDDVEGLIFCDAGCKPPETSEKIEKGTLLGDIMPMGCFLCPVDDTIVEIHPDQIPSTWIKIIYGMRPSHSDGAGLQRIKPLQDMENDRVNLEFKVLMDDAAPTTFLNRKYVTRLSQVGEYTLVDALKEGDNWNNVAFRFQGSGAHPALGNMGERNQGLMQYIAGTFSTFGGGASDIRAAGTATGVAAMAEEVSGRFLEAIKLRTEADINSRYLCAQNRQKKSVKPQLDNLIERFGKDVVERFQNCSLRHTVKIRAKKGTDQPQSQALKIASLQVLGNLQAAVKDSPQAQDILSYASQEMNLPLNIGIGLNTKREAEYRISVLREATRQFNDTELSPEATAQAATEIFAQVLREVERGSETADLLQQKQQQEQSAEQAIVEGADPAQAAAQSQPNPARAIVVMAQNHQTFIEAYSDFLMSETARGANSVFRACVFLMWQLHSDRMLMQQGETVRRQMELQQMAQPPAPAQPSPEEMQAMQDAQRQKAIEEEGLRRAADEEKANRDHSRSEQAKDREVERKIAVEEHKRGFEQKDSGKKDE